MKTSTIIYDTQYTDQPFFLLGQGVLPDMSPHAEPTSWWQGVYWSIPHPIEFFRRVIERYNEERTVEDDTPAPSRWSALAYAIRATGRNHLYNLFWWTRVPTQEIEGYWILEIKAVGEYEMPIEDLKLLAEIHPTFEFRNRDNFGAKLFIYPTDDFVVNFFRKDGSTVRLGRPVTVAIYLDPTWVARTWSKLTFREKLVLFFQRKHHELRRA